MYSSDPEFDPSLKRPDSEYQPFEIYAKALHEYFRGAEMTVGEWELNKSYVYKILDGYQREGYQALMKIARDFNGAFLCDGVGLGKTFIGLMLIERLVEHDRWVYHTFRSLSPITFAATNIDDIFVLMLFYS